MVKMAKKRLKKLLGTNGADELIGTKRMKRIYGRGGNDIISTPEGRFKVWGAMGQTHSRPSTAGRAT